MPSKLLTKFVRWIGYDLGISPNQITIGRLFFFVPGWLLWVYMKEVGDFLEVGWQVVGLFALILVTVVILLDVVDGVLARETGQVTQSGKVLDPAIDKFITYTTLALFWSAIDHVALIVLFILDIVSTFLRGAKNQGANQYGKIKALSQNVSKLFFGIAVLANIPQLNIIGNLFIWLALLMAIISVGIRTTSMKKNDL